MKKRRKEGHEGRKEGINEKKRRNEERKEGKKEETDERRGER